MCLYCLRRITAYGKLMHNEFGYCLDLSYITSRIIAMAFPASGIESWFRNDITEVYTHIKNIYIFIN